MQGVGRFGLALSSWLFLEKNKMKIPKFNFLKESKPKPSALRKDFFAPEKLWLLALLACLVLILFGGLVGFKFFMTVYSEDYKKNEDPSLSVREEMKLETLERALQRRNTVIEREVPIPQDPAF